MTRKEAKEIISRHHWAFASMDDEVIEAIEYLAEDCEDTISRAWLKEAIHNFYYDLKHTPTEEDIQAYIDAAPSVTPTCSVKLNNCEDAISRDYLLSIANTDGAYGYVSAYDIAKAPSVIPKQKMGRWIPVSERLPEVDEDGLSEWVLVTTKNIDKTATMYDRLCANSWLTECFDGEKVLAWQPLPEPYKAESEDTE